MQSATLIGIYLLVTVVLQAIGFGISQLVQVQWPAVSTIEPGAAAVASRPV